MSADEVVESPRCGHVFFPLLQPQSYVEPLDLERVFGRSAPLQVDLGCGNGSFLCALAQRFPGQNFLGIERLLGRVNSAARKAARLPNVRVLRLESSYAVQYLLPAQSVAAFYLLFPDPWPKRRHQRRRVVNDDFVDTIARALSNEGLFHVATDQRDYFDQILEIAGARPDLAAIDPPGFDLPVTKFEQRFREAGTPIYRLVLRKTSPVR